MKCDARRNEIIKCLNFASSPVSAGSLAEKFGVSRQIIVKDIANLRNEGFCISSLSRGYILEKCEKSKRVFKTIHSDDDVEEELNIVVDLGGTVEDVFVYHKFYNKISATLNIKSRHDVKVFLENIAAGKSSLLKNVTSGYHYHTISAESDKTLDMIEKKLNQKGFLAPLKKYEPQELKK